MQPDNIPETTVNHAESTRVEAPSDPQFNMEQTSDRYSQTADSLRGELGNIISDNPGVNFSEESVEMDNLMRMLAGLTRTAKKEPVMRDGEVPIMPIENSRDAKDIIDMGKPVDLPSIIGDADVLMFGERHIDYTIPDFLLTQIQALKSAGVTSFGFEINPDPEIQKIFDEINSGNTERIAEIKWSLGFGNPTVLQTKQKFVTELVKSGIKVYPFASWDKQGSIEAKPYTKEAEEQAAQIIGDHTVDGKTVVLIGAKHAEYNDGRRSSMFPHTADCVRAQGKKSKSIIFAGGMSMPMEYDRDPAVRLRKAASEYVSDPIYIDSSGARVDGSHSDGIVILPVVPFLSAQDPIPPDRVSVGG